MPWQPRAAPLSVAHRVAREIKAGTVSINCYSEGDMTPPFGGYKMSGVSGHDTSAHAHDEGTETETTWIQVAPRLTEADNLPRARRAHPAPANPEWS